jgi:starvation-inducible DNA-binding protein
MKLHATVSRLPADARSKICEALLAALRDGVDLQTQTKVAHWNTKGPYFGSLHPLFDTFVASFTIANDDIAERAVTLGSLVDATARRAGAASRVEEYPADATDGLEHARLLVARFGVYVDGLRAARDVAEKHDDQDTVDLLTGKIEEFEKHAWFLHATLER